MTEPYSGSGSEQQGTDAGGNPAWQDLLKEVPQELHPQLTPILEKWDKGVNDRFQKVHSDYEPWKPVIDRGVDPETTNFALNLLNSINTNPEMVYNALREYYKFGETPQQTGQQGNQQSGQGQQEPSVVDPYQEKYATLERQNEIIAQVLYEQQQSAREAQADTQLDNELSGLKTKYGDYNERYVLAMMQNGMGAEDAVKNYFEWRESEVGKHVPKPLIMGGGGYVPGQNVNVTKMSNSATKDYVVQMLKAAAQQE